ncbi:response regulator transcription factor [Phaeobacter sp. HF9A]|uniref:response regulator transcription factor n=1 Tax=Phaeobacter sp. HF9A TaxID=2721561 RepID=UPI0014316601|nr:response regulator transcription factor [Phaeobacter sp. HF9A]NIZ13520.1 response regulator transcription factor [Phaeobacter sp. HF9A]
MRYLLVEDNEHLANAVVDRLTLDGHVVDRAGDLGTAKDFIATTEYDLILLDIMLPDGDGRQFLREHRTAQRDTPIIVLTARSEVSDRVGVLDLGADDYLVKPFDFLELEARCRAVLRRRSGGASNLQRFGDLAFDPLACTLTVGTRTVQLRNRELRLFEIFICAPDQVFSKPKLVDQLFSYDVEASENAIEVYVATPNGSRARLAPMTFAPLDLAICLQRRMRASLKPIGA